MRRGWGCLWREVKPRRSLGEQCCEGDCWLPLISFGVARRPRALVRLSPTGTKTGLILQAAGEAEGGFLPASAQREELQGICEFLDLMSVIHISSFLSFKDLNTFPSEKLL